MKTPHKYTDPYVINIKNLTDEKIYDVKVLNYDYKSNEKLKYSSPHCSYDLFLRTAIANKKGDTIIGLIRHEAVCDYEKFRLKQQFCCVRTLYEGAEGIKVLTPFFPERKADQISDKVSMLEIEYPLTVNHNLQYDFIMPETEITIFLFPLAKK